MKNELIPKSCSQIQKNNELLDEFKENFENENFRELSIIEFINVLPQIINKVYISENSVYIDFNKSLILKSQNTVNISDNLNITLAKNIHLNPELNLKMKEVQFDNSKN